MKTNVVLKSADRNLFGLQVRQETKTGFLNLSDLQQVYNMQAEKNGWCEKRIDHLITQKENSERIYYVLKEQDLINVSFNTYLENIENYGGMFKWLKHIEVYKTTGARNTKTTWCNPYIWILVALELHPQFYAKTVIWLTDNLIINRIEAGNFYKGLTKAVGKFNNVDYVKLAKALNYIVFGRHETGIRNTANQKELKELEVLERNLAYAIDFDFLKTFDEVLEHLRKIWHQKQNNFAIN